MYELDDLNMDEAVLKQYSGEEEKITPGLNLRYLYDKDFKDWALSRGEWSGRA